MLGTCGDVLSFLGELYTAETKPLLAETQVAIGAFLPQGMWRLLFAIGRNYLQRSKQCLSKKRLASGLARLLGQALGFGRDLSKHMRMTFKYIH